MITPQVMRPISYYHRMQSYSPAQTAGRTSCFLSSRTCFDQGDPVTHTLRDLTVGKHTRWGNKHCGILAGVDPQLVEEKQEMTTQ